MKYLKGTFSDHEKGYISGAFFPEESLNHDERVEINISKLPDDFTAAKHLHEHTKTWVLVIKGKMYFNIDEEPIEVAAGEFLVFEANVPEEVVKVDPGTENITIHAPSISGGDKVVLQ